MNKDYVKLLNDRQNNLEMLGDLFEYVYELMTHPNGNRHTMGHTHYIDRQNILTIVNQACDKAEQDALDVFRTMKRKGMSTDDIHSMIEEAKHEHSEP